MMSSQKHSEEPTSQWFCIKVRDLPSVTQLCHCGGYCRTGHSFLGHSELCGTEICGTGSQRSNLCGTAWYMRDNSDSCRYSSILARRRRKKIMFSVLRMKFSLLSNDLSQNFMRQFHKFFKNMRGRDMRDRTPASEYMRDIPPVPHILCGTRKLWDQSWYALPFHVLQPNV